MSETRVEEHASLIRTPKQLIIVVLLAFAVPVGLISILASFVVGGGDYSKSNPQMSDEAIAKRLQPVGTVVITEGGAPGAEKSGKEVYDAVCTACHATGVLNAPKLGDKAAWAKLIAEGQEKLTADAIKGVRQMPPRGGNPNLSDAEFARAVVYMANAAGADWKAPETKPSAPPVAAAAPAAAPAGGGADIAKGKIVFEKTCMVCHATGVAGAPKAGDKAAWASHLAHGIDDLYKNAIKGIKAMPPKGGNPSLSDAEVKAAVDYMVSLVK
jgi:cytochrome c5